MSSGGREIEFERQLAAAWPTERWAGMRVLVAVSGGADSVALVRAVARLSEHNGARPSVAHFNHRLRGAASDADQRFVEQLARRLGLEVHVGLAGAELAAGAADGLEAAARDARYRFLSETAERIGARYVVTGHTADDQAETILHHILRGTGLAGLAGMPRVRMLSPAVTLIRPLLATSRSEVLAYLEALGQPFCEDATNADASLTRNWLRHELLPRLSQEYSTGIRETLLRLGEVARDAQRVIEAEAEKLLERATVEADESRLVIDCRQVSAADVHLVREMFALAWRRLAWPRQAMGWEEWNLLAELAGGGAEVPGKGQGAPGRRVANLPGGVRADKTGEQLVLTR